MTDATPSKRCIWATASTASLAYTGDKVQATGAFDEQQAVVARVAYSPIANADWRWVVSTAGTDVFKVTNPEAQRRMRRGPSRSPIRPN